MEEVLQYLKCCRATKPKVDRVLLGPSLATELAEDWVSQLAASGGTAELRGGDELQEVLTVGTLVWTLWVSVGLQGWAEVASRDSRCGGGAAFFTAGLLLLKNLQVVIFSSVHSRRARTL